MSRSLGDVPTESGAQEATTPRSFSAALALEAGRPHPFLPGNFPIRQPLTSACAPLASSPLSSSSSSKSRPGNLNLGKVFVPASQAESSGSGARRGLRGGDSGASVITDGLLGVSGRGALGEGQARGSSGESLSLIPGALEHIFHCKVFLALSPGSRAGTPLQSLGRGGQRPGRTSDRAGLSQGHGT